MARAIRVVVTSVYTYVPNLNEESYQAAGCATIEDALWADQDDVNSGDFSLDEIVDKDPIITREWSIIDV